ncbi:MAG TPA: 3-carboxy-cis,cis-muconate cycloisomerase [Stellaceae bacterium]|jgi:3-carboxy-cis,cis-muconate cycloisomerase|nr:3-carboxy-cis,cis-muconate cycloisomerase [Stellaceae bacterium]
MTVALFEHPYLSRLLGDDEVARFFTAEADLDAMLAFEAALAEAEGAEGVISAEAANAIRAGLSRFRADIPDLALGVSQDGVVIPNLVAQIRAAIGEPHARSVHKGATSQDVIDSSLFMRLKKVATILDHRLAGVIGQIEALNARMGERVLMGHTRMQRARPISVAHKLAGWHDPLVRHRERLAELTPRAFTVQFGGAVGNRAELGDKAGGVVDRLADILDLPRASRARHVERDGIADFASWLSLVAGSLGKIGIDVALMAQNEVAEVKLATGGKSSAMPDKSNPVPAETLVTLARFNATLVAGMHQSLVHENERSGMAWTLEWMLLPQMAVATGAALRTAAELLAAMDIGKD